MCWTIGGGIDIYGVDEGFKREVGNGEKGTFLKRRKFGRRRRKKSDVGCTVL